MMHAIYKELAKIIPDIDELEIIYGEHYDCGEYNPIHHALYIRDVLYSESYTRKGEYRPPRTFDLDTVKITQALEKALPVKVDFGKVINIEHGKTFKFYITILEE